MDHEDFRRAGHALIDWVADFRAGIAGLPVMARVEPGQVRARVPRTPPAEPEPFARVLADLDEFVVPGLSHFQHPRFFGYFPSNALLASVLGDYLSSGLGALGLSWQAAPALTEIEEAMLDWLKAPTRVEPVMKLKATPTAGVYPAPQVMLTRPESVIAPPAVMRPNSESPSMRTLRTPLAPCVNTPVRESRLLPRLSVPVLTAEEK